MSAAIGAIVIDLHEERALKAPHIEKHVRDKVAGDGDDGDEVTLARGLAALDALIHLLILGHAQAQVKGKIDGGVAAVRRALLGNMFGLEEGGAGDVLAGGETQKAGQMLTIRETVDVTHFADQSQSIADTGSVNGAQQRGLGTGFDKAIAGLEVQLLVLLGVSNVLGELADPLVKNVSPDGASEGLTTELNQLLGIGQAESGATMVMQDGGDGLRTCGNELIGQKVVLEQSVDRSMMQLSLRKDLAQGGIVGAQKGT